MWYKGTHLFFRPLYLLFLSFLSIFSKLSTERNIFRVDIFPRSTSTRYKYLPCVVVGTPSSTKAGSEKEELAAFTFPSFATIFLRSSVPPLFQPPPSRPLSTSSRSTSQQRFSAFDICDLNFRYREFPERKCRLIVLSVTLLGPSSPSTPSAPHSSLLLVYHSLVSLDCRR